MAERDGLVVGVDVATSAVRAFCVDPAGNVIASGAAQLPPPATGPGGRVEQDANSWWPATRHALAAMSANLGADAASIRSLAITATSGTIVLVDRRGAPLGAALMYHDSRAAAEAELAMAADAERWARLGIGVGPSSALAKLGWLAARGELPNGARLCHVPDLIGERLTGGPVPTDWSHALKSGYDPRRREWAHEALAALGVEEAILPTVVAPSSVAGVLSGRAARETGLPPECELRLGMTDGCTAQLACGAIECGQFVTVLGTTCVIKGVAAEVIHDPSGAVYSHLHPDGRLWLPGGASNTGGEALATFSRERLDELGAAASARGPASLLCYPLRREGERFPFAAPQARGFATAAPEDEVDAFRAALEGVAFVERLGYERLEALGASARGAIASGGGGSRSAAWLAIRATALGRPVRVTKHPHSAFGAALLAASGSLHRNLAAAGREMVRPRRQVEPNAAEGAALEARFQDFKEALRERGWVDWLPDARIGTPPVSDGTS